MSKVRNVEERGNRLGRTLSSRLANRDNRVSPCSHCVQRLPAIYKPHTVVRRKEKERERERKRENLSLLDVFPSSKCKNEERDVVTVLYGCHEEATMRRRMRDFPIEWRHGPRAFRPLLGLINRVSFYVFTRYDRFLKRPVPRQVPRG